MRAPFADRRVLALAIVSFFGLPLANGWILFRGFGEPAAGVVLGGLTGLVASFCAIPLLHVLAVLRDASTIARAASGTPPRDGRRSAVSGRIRPRGMLLGAPISGRPCLAYHWEARSEIVNSKGMRGKEAIVAEGLSLAPCDVAGPHGRTILLDFGGLAAFPMEETSGPATGRVAEVLARPRGARKNRGPDGSLVEEHRAYFTWTPDAPLKLIERVVLPDDPVAAVGVFSAREQALHGSRYAPLELGPGSFEAFTAPPVGLTALQALGLAAGLLLIEWAVFWMADFARGSGS
jgi:hypothetical protein